MDNQTTLIMIGNTAKSNNIILIKTQAVKQEITT